MIRSFTHILLQMAVASAACVFPTAALAQTGSLVQWGATSAGQANNAPPAAGPYIAIAAGAYHSVALKADGSLVQWGDASRGQTNNAPPAAGPYIAIAAGGVHTLALKADGSLVQWGATSAGQANNAPPAAGPYIAIAAGDYHCLALRTDGSLVQWGNTSFGQTANAPPPAGPYIAIAAGSFHGLALTADGTLVQWGGISSGETNNAPPSTGPYKAIAADFNHNLALTGVPIQATSFTYQGQLTGTGGPVDLRFRLYTAATGGSAVGQVTNAANVTLSPSGIFTATVSPGSVDLSVPLWVEVAVAQSGSGNYSTLSPRQPMTPAPKATFARSAMNASYAGIASFAEIASSAETASFAASAPWSGITGMPPAVAAWSSQSNGIAYTGGTVGIGTITPEGGLSITNYKQNLSPQQPGVHMGRECCGYTSSTAIEIVADVGGSPVIDFNTLPSTDDFGARLHYDKTTDTLYLDGANWCANAFCPSSSQLKENVAPITGALDSLSQLQGVRFDWKPTEAPRHNTTHDFGFIAEDVQKVFPEVVVKDKDGNVLGMDYARLTSIAVEAIKQLKSENDRMKTDNETVKRENAELKARLDRIEAMLARDTGATK